ncbi:unnamed protein product [Didymodactylos carnosus]|uniref:ETS domain-containing protein n=1 Tax=Didymodactylos carnosus TaxID=1234261 RepID=A0A8S2R9Q8_9BILA|nr:unnamed protein product [Didymodactylos carnosus]CAF4147312.1 unnamed protein product [Didymodactylos carnosus]
MLFTKEMFAAQSPISSQCSGDKFEPEKQSWSVIDCDWRKSGCQQQPFSDEAKLYSRADILQTVNNTRGYTHSGYFQDRSISKLFLNDQEESIFRGDLITLLRSLATPQYCGVSPSNSFTSGQVNILHQQQQVEAQSLTNGMFPFPTVPVSNKLSEKLNGSSFNFSTSMDHSTLLPTTPPRMLSRVADIADWLVVDSTTKRERRPLLHEFLRRLLNNPEYHHLATYVVPKEGIFKLHKPDDVADLWQYIKGRKSKKRMTYDTFSRGIRYYYRKGVMKANPGQHTFRFGPQLRFSELWRPWTH